MEGSLTHLDATGRARLVDVSAKTATERYARARAVVRMSPEAAARVAAGDNPTGVEMEAMVACSVGALTVYDMVKGIEPGVVIERVELLEKTGGKSDFHRT